MPKSKTISKFLILATILLFQAASVHAQSGKGSPLSIQSLSRDMEILTGPGFGGRKTGSAEMVAVSAWIKDRFEEAGLVPYGESWYDSFALKDGRIGRNIVGCIPGKSGKWVVIGASYDGIGTIDGRLYPGADANASGVSALLAIAGALGETPRNGDGVIFIAFDGRNSEYAGAFHIARRLPGRNRIRMMISLDILGCTLVPVHRKIPGYLIALGAERYEKSLDKAAADNRITVYYDYYGSQGFTELFLKKLGDQRAFFEKGIPSIVFTSGITDNTNKTTDTKETLDYEIFRARVLTITRWLSRTIG